MSLSPGSRLGHYDVTALIGEGGMGQVYRANDTKLRRLTPGAHWSKPTNGLAVDQGDRCRHIVPESRVPRILR